MNTYFCEYNIINEHLTREKYLTLFGGMRPEDDQFELGNVNLLGRWTCVGESRGMCVVQANNNVDIQRWVSNWTTMSDIKVKPCLDDNLIQELILGYTNNEILYNRVSEPALDEESLYIIKYKFYTETGFEKMVKENLLSNPENHTSYGIWHMPNSLTSFEVVSTGKLFNLYKWVRKNKDLCSTCFYPVIDDVNTRLILQDSYGFSEKYITLMDELLKLEHPQKRCF